MKKLLAIAALSLLPLTAQADGDVYARHMAATQLVEYINAQYPFDNDMQEQLPVALAGFADVPCAKESLPEIRTTIQSGFSYAVLKPYLIQAYENNFSFQELVDITTFFHTQSGAHWLARQPLVAASLQQASAQLMVAKQGDIKTILARHTAANGQCIAQEKHS